jgi:hypothetical protein
MGQRMRRPGVVWITGERLTAAVLGALEVAGLLEPEGVKPEDEARERIAALPGRQRPRGAVADRHRPAEEEISILHEAQGERVGGMIDEDHLPAEDRPRGFALRPRLGGGEVAPLALRGAPNRHFGRAERTYHLRVIAAKAADHIERRDRDAAQCKTGVAGERRF